MYSVLYNRRMTTYRDRMRGRVLPDIAPRIAYVERAPIERALGSGTVTDGALRAVATRRGLAARMSFRRQTLSMSGRHSRRAPRV